MLPMNRFRNAIHVGTAVVVLLGVFATAGHADIINGSFEAGGALPTGWSIVGLGGASGAQDGGPTDGIRQMTLLTGRTGSGGVENTPASPQATVEAFLNLTAGVLDGIGEGGVLEGTAVKQDFQANARDVLSFDWNFNAPACHPNPAIVCTNDLAFVSLVGIGGTSFTQLEVLANRRTDVTDTTLFQRFMFELPVGGMFTLGIGVMDAGFSNLGISELHADNVTLTPGATVPEPGTLALLTAGLAGAVTRRWRTTMKVR